MLIQTYMTFFQTKLDPIDFQCKDKHETFFKIYIFEDKEIHTGLEQKEE